MKSFCASGLVALVAVGWTAQAANAQSGGYSASLLPWPNAAPVARYASNSYYSNPQTPTTAAGSSTGSWDPAAEGAKPQSEIEEALHAPCWSCDGCTPRGWFAGAGALAMGRTRANPFWTTYETNNNVNQLLNTQSAGADWAAGGQFTVGYAWCGPCGPSLGFTYWGLAPMEGFASLVAPTGTTLSTPINLLTQTGSVLMNNGNPASQYFDSASEHRIWRSDIVNNLEINAMTGIYQVGYFQVAALAGFRYFRFAEDLTFGSVSDTFNFGDNNGAEEAYLGFRCINNLYGGQVGALINSNMTERLSFFLVPKFGLYGNQMNVRTQLYTGDEVNNPTYNILAHKTDVAVMGELDAGFSWAFADNWRAFLGYRIVGVNNLALGDNQFLPYLADTQGFAEVKQNGSLILHGAFGGLGFMF